MSCVDKKDSACPFAFTDRSDSVQNLGCLPTPHDIRNMRVAHGKTWACHERPEKPCAGAILWLKDEGLPHKVIDPILLTERSEWHLYTSTTPKAAQEGGAA